MHEGQVRQPGDIWRTPDGEERELVSCESAGDYIARIGQHQIAPGTSRPSSLSQVMQRGQPDSREREAREGEVARMNRVRSGLG